MRVDTIEQLKQLLSQVIFTQTDKITKITPGSVVNAFVHGNAKMAQKIIKDIILNKITLLPSFGSGETLDASAINFGISERFGAIGSSTYVRIFAAPGTYYSNGLVLNSQAGISFSLDEEITIGDAGFAYALISSLSVGENTNIDSFNIKSITNPPTGHIAVTNENSAFGGRDIETDEQFRERIINSVNLLARGTISMLENVFFKINTKVSRVFNMGASSTGKIRLGVLSQNGSLFVDEEFLELIEGAKDFLTLNELNLTSTNFEVGIELVNVEFLPIDVSVRVKMKSFYNVSEVRKLIQIRINKLFSNILLKQRQKIDWDDILLIIKTTPGVDYVLDEYVYPGQDIPIGFGVLPRLRGFLFLDEFGSLLSDGTQDLVPAAYYESDNLDFSFQSNILSNL